MSLTSDRNAAEMSAAFTAVPSVVLVRAIGVLQHSGGPQVRLIPKDAAIYHLGVIYAHVNAKACP
jgi:hypothetical protein